MCGLMFRKRSSDAVQKAIEKFRKVGRMWGRLSFETSNALSEDVREISMLFRCYSQRDPDGKFRCLFDTKRIS